MLGADPQHRDSSIRFVRTHWRTALDIVTTIAVLGAAVVIIASRFQGARPNDVRATIPIPKIPVSLEGAALSGNPSAPVGILVFSDFQCPFCGQFARNVLPDIKKSYVDTDRAQLAFRHLPLTMHPLAMRAAEAAECARRQDKFWEMHDQMFREPARLEKTDLLGYARSIGVDSTRFQECMSSADAAAHVEQDRAAAHDLGVETTPMIMIGAIQSGGSLKVQRLISGARPYQEFQVAIDAILNRR